MNTPKTTPKDFFLHLGATVALYIAAIALMNLAFTTINSVFPDALGYYFDADSIVWPISILIVLTPLLYVIEWTISKDVQKMPEKINLAIRRWRIYLTLFLTGAAIVGDLIALINTYLNGEISSRFIYKVLVVLIVSGVIFAYYLISKGGLKSVWQKTLTWIGAALVLIAIIAGFVVVGSPSTRRAIRFDEQRVSDLQNIQYLITNYWQTAGKLPQDLPTLNDPITNAVVPKDPETGNIYLYRITDKTSFELCANFSLASGSTTNSNGGIYSRPIPAPISGNVNENWKHNAGKYCFQRTLDPARFPATKI